MSKETGNHRFVENIANSPVGITGIYNRGKIK